MSGTELANYDAARWFVAEARRVDEVKDFRDKGRRACYARRLSKSAEPLNLHDSHNDADRTALI